MVESDYAEDVEGQLVREAHERFLRDPAFFDPFGGLLAYLGQRRQALAAAREYQARQGEQLAAAQDRRDPPDLGGTDYLGHEHTELKQWVTTNFGPENVHDIGRAWNSVGETLRELETALRSAAGREFTGRWQGAAAERAHTYTTELAGFAGTTGDGFKLMGNRISVQGDAAQAARAMPDPVEFDLRTELFRALTAPNPWAGMAGLQARFAEKQEKHAEAARYLTTMEGRFAESASTMPAFAPVPRFADADAGRSAGGADRPVVVPQGSGGHVTTQQPPVPVSPAGLVSPAQSAIPDRPGQAVPPAATLPAGSTLSAPGVPSVGGPGGPGGLGGQGGLGGPGRGTGPPWLGAGGPVGGRDPRGIGGPAGARPGAGGPGARSGVGGPGGGGSGAGGSGGRLPGMGRGLGVEPGAGAGHGPNAGAGAGQGPGAGQRPGLGTGPGAEHGANARPGVDGRSARAGGAGASGAGGAGGMGGGAPGGRWDDDEVRGRPSWLVETDEDVWGGNELVAPPVIGESPR